MCAADGAARELAAGGLTGKCSAPSGRGASTRNFEIRGARSEAYQSSENITCNHLVSSEPRT